MEETVLVSALQHFKGYKGSYSFRDQKFPTLQHNNDFLLVNTDETKKQWGEHWLILRKIEKCYFEQIDSDYRLFSRQELLNRLPEKSRLISPTYQWQSRDSFACGEFCLAALFLIRFHHYFDDDDDDKKTIEDIERYYFKENEEKRNELFSKHLVYNYILIHDNPPQQKEIQKWLQTKL